MSLEEKNLPLKKLVVDPSLGKVMLRDGLAKKLMLARLRECARDLQVRCGASERQIYFALRVSRSSFHYRSVPVNDKCADPAYL
ncbi:hypothetical protein [Serratia nevei]|uniref:hypothetical protein n=1 Tax=Serratia nevei TaxID=2703794 RepID=UPI003FA6989F